MRSSSSAVRLLCRNGFLLASTAAFAQSAKKTSSAPSDAARGKYLVDIMSCNDCHTPMKMGANGPRARHDPISSRVIPLR